MCAWELEHVTKKKKKWRKNEQRHHTEIEIIWNHAALIKHLKDNFAVIRRKKGEAAFAGAFPWQELGVN